MRILIVSADPGSAGQVADFLSQLGHASCGSAGTLLQTLEAVQRHRPDLMIVDVDPANSLAAVDAATQVFWNWGTRSLFLGAAFDGAFQDKTSGIRAVGYLRKPLAVEVLRRVLDGVLDGLPGRPSLSSP